MNEAGLTVAVRDYGDDAESIGTSYQYDSKGNLTEEVYENGAYKKYIYDERNLLIQTESYAEDDTLTMQTEYTYDDQYRLIKTVDSKAEDKGKYRDCLYIQWTGSASYSCYEPGRSRNRNYNLYL